MTSSAPRRSAGVRRGLQPSRRDVVRHSAFLRLADPVGCRHITSRVIAGLDAKQPWILRTVTFSPVKLLPITLSFDASARVVRNRDN